MLGYSGDNDQLWTPAMFVLLADGRAGLYFERVEFCSLFRSFGNEPFERCVVFGNDFFFV